MAARPNTFRTLVYGEKLAKAQLARLDKAIAQATSALSTNVLLEPAQVEAYKYALKACAEQRKIFTRAAEQGTQVMDVAGKPRKPGRPSQADVDAVALARTGKAPQKLKAAAPVVAAATEPKRRGRPPKAVASVAVAAPVAAPKKRGRPPKAVASAAVAAPVAAAPVAAPKKRGRPPKAVVAATVVAAPVAMPKRRGRPAKVAPVAAPSIAQQAFAAVQGATAAKRRGRPPKAKLNGAGALAALN